jgi:hypothetical protein
MSEPTVPTRARPIVDRLGARGPRTAVALLVVLLAVPALPGAAALVAPPASTAPAGAPSVALAPLAPHAPAALSPALLHQLLTPVYTPAGGRTAFQQLRAEGVDPAVSPLTSTSNFAIPGSDCASFGVFTPFEPTPYGAESVVAAPGSNTTIVVAGGSDQGVFNSSGGTPCSSIAAPDPFFGSHGATAIYRSTDGGQTWKTTWLAQNTTHWLSSSDPTNGTINWGQASLASSAGGTMLVSELAIPNCWFNFTNYPAELCNSNASYEEPWSIAVARSTDAGVSWSVPAQIGTAQAVKWVNVTPSCLSVFTSGSGLYYNSIAEHPSVAINPSNGVAIVTWDVFSLTFDMSTCTIAQAATTYASLSTDNGATWGTPKAIVTGFSEYPEAVIGPAPTDAISVYYDDVANSTSSATSWSAVVSSDNGTTWGIPRPVSLDSANVIFGLGGTTFVQPETFLGLTPPSVAEDSHAASPYAGGTYLAWWDNQTGGNAGTPAIDVIVRAAGGSTWSTPVTVSSGSSFYFQPSVAVGPSGTVYITYYGYSTSSASYQLYGVASTDGGTTWSSQFRVTDQASTPPGGWADLGVWTGAAATSNGVYPAWVDCRSAACASTYDDVLYTANAHAVALSTNIAGVNATVTALGGTSTFALPSTVLWDNASSVTVTVPQFLPDPANDSDVFTFQGYSGIVASSNYQTTFTYSGQAGGLSANYQAVPAAILRGTVAPLVPGLGVTVNGVPTPLTGFNATADQYKAAVPGGLSYTIAASATNYQTATHTTQTGSGGTYWWNVTLQKQVGYIVGTLTPASAGLTVNGTPVTTVNQATGLYNVTVAFGAYWVNATGTGLTAFHRYVTVSAGLSTRVDVTLIGGWVQGIVLGAAPNKPGLSVELDGVPIGVSNSGAFNNSTLGGYHTLTATQPGYNLSSISLFVTPGHTTMVNVSLTNRGWIGGMISPLDAVHTAILHIYSGSTGSYYAINSDGSFNVTTLVGFLNYTVNVTATNYQSFQQIVYVTPGNGSQLTITLSPVQGCTGPSCTQQPPPNNASGGGISTTTLIIIVVVIVAVAAIAVVLLTRRRGGGSGPAADDEGETPVYQESNPSQLPRLQPDGSMGPGNPPPPTS